MRWPGSVAVAWPMTSGMTSTTRPANGPDDRVDRVALGERAVDVDTVGPSCSTSTTAWSFDALRIAPIWVRSTTTNTTMLYITSVAPVPEPSSRRVGERQSVPLSAGFRRSFLAIDVAVCRSHLLVLAHQQHRRERHQHSKTMYTVIDGLSNTSESAEVRGQRPQARSPARHPRPYRPAASSTSSEAAGTAVNTASASDGMISGGASSIGLDDTAPDANNAHAIPTTAVPLQPFAGASCLSSVSGAGRGSPRSTFKPSQPQRLVQHDCHEGDHEARPPTR